MKLNYDTFAKILVLLVLLIFIIVFSVHPQTAPLKAELTFSAVMAALGSIFIIVLLVERVTEIFITIWYQSQTDILKKEIKSLAKDPTKTSELPGKQKELAVYQTKTKSAAMLVGFSISVIVCCAGVGLLSAVIDINKANQSFLRAVDIILTSGLIAGGSDSFHQFVSAFEAFFIESKERMENKP